MNHGIFPIEPIFFYFRMVACTWPFQEYLPYPDFEVYVYTIKLHVAWGSSGEKDYVK